MSSEVPRKTYLLIGTTGAGKSTFYNRLREIATYSHEHVDKVAPTGDGDVSCTRVTKYYDMDVPLAQWELIDTTTGEVPELAEVTDEQRMWKKNIPVQLHNYDGERYVVRQKREPGGVSPRVLHLRIIDTPGLGDNRAGKDATLDLEHITNVLRQLASLSGPTRLDWEKFVHGVILMAPAMGYFGESAIKTVRFYRDCMPDLFRQLIMVNTRFGFLELFDEREKMRAKSLGRPARIRKHESCEEALKSERLEYLHKMLTGDRNDGQPVAESCDAPEIFYVDNKPPAAELPFEDMRSRNKMMAILEKLRKQSPMRIGQMAVSKEQNMKSVDKRVLAYLDTVGTRLHIRMEAFKRARTDGRGARQAHRSELLTEIGLLQNQLAHVDRELEPLDNKDEFPIGTHTTVPRVTNWRVVVSRLTGNGLTGELLVREDNHPGFQVRADGNKTGAWTWRGWADHGVEWRGEYRATPGHRAELEAQTYVLNCVRHASKISTLKSAKSRLKRELEEAEDEFSRLFANEKEGSFNREEESIDKQLLALQYLKTQLATDPVRIDEGFSEATAAMYGTKASAIGERHVYEFIKDTQRAAKGEPRQNLTRLLDDWASLSTHV